MKVQDAAFLLIFLINLWQRNEQIFVISGLLFLVLAVPLFHFQIFFTAERFTWYAAAFFVSVTLIQLIKLAKEEK